MPSAEPPVPDVFDRLCAQAMRQGCLLFTITAADRALTSFDRRYTSHPVEYPVSGTKPIERDVWYDHVITGRQSFVANTPADFEKHFFDHALITSMGLGSCLNIPLISGERVFGTVNFLAGGHHFTPARLENYHAMTHVEAPALTKALRRYWVLTLGQNRQNADRPVKILAPGRGILLRFGSAGLP